MTERPILFSGPMVRAILAGTKTQTRRVITPPFERLWGRGIALPGNALGVRSDAYHVHVRSWEQAEDRYIYCPYGVPGDRLWVRETWAPWDEDTRDFLDFGARRGGDKSEVASLALPALYRADYERAGDDPADLGAATHRWRPSIFMPRAACRLVLEVTEVRVQRLHEISEEDAKAEGVELSESVRGTRVWHASHRAAFAGLWEVINGKRAPWSSNPWVWCVSFKRVEA